MTAQIREGAHPQANPCANPCTESSDRIFHLSSEGEEGSAAAHKFWRVRLDGSVQTVRFGRIETVGQTCTKTFPSAAEAGKATGRLIAQKVNKGYREVTPEQAAQVSPKRKRKQPQQQHRSPKPQWQQLALPF